ncbi:MAG: tetratricopeptide repeat protein [Novosphingobium sp.]|uniref:tetratricopeptide repeat protein n=1 Tax=Novosphingobium sp. TaxID=1874826 RepID=UPI0027365650|nr:tetratricopeptide repeat protein [Novosphingobium sp.]MDP3551594.1 tetratricopeptide repeat protein [Novosphingobium sp.]
MTCSSSTISRARAFAAALALTLLAAAPARSDAPADALASARAALAKGDGIAAEVPLQQALRNGVPGDAVRAELGEALLLQGDRRKAREVLMGGDFAPASAARGWQMRGRLELEEGRLVEAGQAFDQSHRISADNASLWIDIGRLRFIGGEHAQAIDAAERAIKLNPKDPRGLELRGLLIREQFGLQSALQWFEAGLRIAPDDVGLLSEYAATLGDLGQYRAMLIVCRKLAKVDPGNVRALYLQAVLAARAGQTALSRKILLQTGKTLRDLPAAIMLNGILEYRSGNTNLAVEHFDRLVRMQPDNLQARMMLVRALRSRGLDAQAAQAAGVWANLQSAPPYLLQLTGEAYRAQGRKTESATLFDRAGEEGQRPSEYLPAGQPLGVLAISYGDGPNLASNAVPYIRGLIEAGEDRQAIAVADRLKLANPGAAEAWLLAGDARLIGNDALGALDQYGRGALIRFNLPTLQRIDHALRLAGRDAEANAVAARYLRQNPGNPQALKLLSYGRAALDDMVGAERIEAVLVARGLRNP